MSKEFKREVEKELTGPQEADAQFLAVLRKSSSSVADGKLR